MREGESVKVNLAGHANDVYQECSQNIVKVCEPIAGKCGCEQHEAVANLMREPNFQAAFETATVVFSRQTH